MDRLFAYGTLLAPELRGAVIGRAVEGDPAVLPGYACYRVRRAAYPAIVQQQGTNTHGSLFAGIEPTEWDRLDNFESHLYERRLVEVTLSASSHRSAYAYVVAATFRHRVSEEPWRLERFRRDRLNRYLNRLSREPEDRPDQNT
ncbi:MAG TPA: gamma-glutamylcyclotransferase family protein [Gammaproteobacteria bacterium]|nr:gamma-glutamylcyclotransferase family protein [Gammaproteobacteria bacterium]